MKLFLRPKGGITSRFFATEAYREVAHTGIDFQFGFKKPHHAVADGYIYKVKGKTSSNLQEYRQVHQICETPLGPMEVAYVHCWDILVSEGDKVVVGQPIMTEGNTGSEVFEGGVRVTPEQKVFGKGSHLHLSVRPVERVSKKIKGEFYLETATGKPYKDEKGNFYRVKNKDNGAKGWVNYEEWLYTASNNEYIALLTQALTFVRSLLK